MNVTLPEVDVPGVVLVTVTVPVAGGGDELVEAVPVTLVVVPVSTATVPDPRGVVMSTVAVGGAVVVVVVVVALRLWPGAFSEPLPVEWASDMTTAPGAGADVVPIMAVAPAIPLLKVTRMAEASAFWCFNTMRTS